MPSLWWVVGILGAGAVIAFVIALLVPWSDDEDTYEDKEED